MSDPLPPPGGRAQVPPPPPPPPPGGTGGAAGAGTALPGVIVAAAAAATTAVVMLLVGLVLAVALPKASITSVEIVDGSTIKAAFRGAASATLATFDVTSVDYVIRIMPAIFLLVLLLVCAGSVRVLSSFVPGVREMAANQRLLWGLATGVPLAILMFVFGFASKESPSDGVTLSVSVASLILLSLLWGALGGFAGALWALRSEGRLGEVRLSPAVARVLAVLKGALVPLVALLVVSTIVGTSVWVIQAARNAGDMKAIAASYAGTDDPASTGGLILDVVLFAPDNGIHFAELGAGAQFHTPIFDTLGLPAPVTDARDVYDTDDAQEFLQGDDLSTLTPEGAFRIFNYSGALPAALFIASFLLSALVLAAALWAGYRVARSATGGAGGALGRSLGYGALVGPIWAVTMIALNALIQKDIMGKAVGLSVGLNFLVIGAVLGAFGGLLAASRGSTDGASALPAGVPPPPPPPPA
ncbi:MAG: hypothetical protein H6533_05575 [Thermoleophilales bacterium]|nr:hypothetical protein [Thermoleophilales bacterium]